MLGRHSVSCYIWNDGKDMSKMSLKIMTEPRMNEGTTAKTWMLGAWQQFAVDVLCFSDSKANLLIKFLPGSCLLV